MIKLKNIKKTYKADTERIHVLKGITLEIHEGDFLAIAGPSGSGKSTLLNLLGFVDRNYSGKYYLDKDEVKLKNDLFLSNLRNQRVGFVFQDFNLIETLTIEENIELPLLYNGWRRKNTKNHVYMLLRKLGIEDKGKKYPNQLSGGQKQRVAIARAIVNNPDFILADEPTGSLDTETSIDIMNVFKHLNKEGITIVLVTHDQQILSYCNRILHMKDGELLEEER